MVAVQKPAAGGVGEPGASGQRPAAVQVQCTCAHIGARMAKASTAPASYQGWLDDAAWSLESSTFTGSSVHTSLTLTGATCDTQDLLCLSTLTADVAWHEDIRCAMNRGTVADRHLISVAHPHLRSPASYCAMCWRSAQLACQRLGSWAMPEARTGAWYLFRLSDRRGELRGIRERSQASYRSGKHGLASVDVAYPAVKCLWNYDDVAGILDLSGWSTCMLGVQDAAEANVSSMEVLQAEPAGRSAGRGAGSAMLLEVFHMKQQRLDLCGAVVS